ncbi:DNA polymerase IV [Bacillus sp. TS-2]|nr:DNA polymerase IV [Bacillus sp. TS-2]
MKHKVILHIDMNSFYASVEMSYDPKLRGKPIAIAGNVEKRKGIIVTSSYEARAKGVQTAMPVWKALNLCPKLILLPPNFERYKSASKAMFDILRSYTDLVEPVSIDEGYMDVSNYLSKGHPYQLAEEIQRRLQSELDLPSSIGIAPNKFLAKMASDMKKPLGITILRKRDIERKLWPLQIEEMHGIGKRTTEKWKKLQINTIGDLAKANERTIEQHFGINGIRLLKKANGHDKRPVDPNSIHEFKSVGHSTTLPFDTNNESKILKEIGKLVQMVQQRLKRKKVCAFGVQLMIRYHDWRTITRSKKIEEPLQEDAAIYSIAMKLFKDHWNGESIRLIGISTYDLVDQKYAYKQLDLFEYESEEKKYKLSETVEQLREKFGEKVFRNLQEITEDESTPSPIRTSFQRDFLEH